MKNQGETMTCREAKGMDRCHFIARPKLDEDYSPILEKGKS